MLANKAGLEKKTGSPEDKPASETTPPPPRRLLRFADDDDDDESCRHPRREHAHRPSLMASQETREEADFESALSGGDDDDETTNGKHTTPEEEEEDGKIVTQVCDVRMDDAGTSIKSINQYEIVKPLGKGSFAEVFLCIDQDKDEFAVKIFNKSLLRRKRTVERTAAGTVVHSELEKVQREIDIMKKLVHKNLVCLYEVIDDHEEDQLYMFMEYVEIGPVMTYDKTERVFRSKVTRGVLDECAAAHYLLDIAAGLKFLHQNCIAHRDLKPDNVLLGVDGHCKIADFGVAHYFAKDRHKKAAASVAALERSKSRAQMFETQGTYCFWAPEMVDVERSFNAYACDMWAAGVCLYIFLSGTCPFYSDAVTDLFDQIRAANLDMPSQYFSDDAKRIVAGLLRVDVATRLTVNDLEADEWLTSKSNDASRPDLTRLASARHKKQPVRGTDDASADTTKNGKHTAAKKSAASSYGGIFSSKSTAGGGRKRDDDDDDAAAEPNAARRSTGSDGVSSHGSDRRRRRWPGPIGLCKGFGRIFNSASTAGATARRKPRRQDTT